MSNNCCYKYTRVISSNTLNIEKKNQKCLISLKYSKPVYETLFEICLYISAMFLFLFINCKSIIFLRELFSCTRFYY